MKSLFLKNTVLILLVLLSFGGSISNDYSLDDGYVTTSKNKMVSKGVNGIKEIITSAYLKIENTGTFGYRPITKITFALEHQFFGFDPGISHVINLLLYICIVLLIFKLIRILFSSTPEWVLFLICALFAVHPLHSEVVLSLKNREELLAALFGFLTLYCAITYFEKRKIITIICGFLFILLGVSTKKTFLPFILFIPVSLWYLKRINWKQSSLFFVSTLVFSYLAFTLPRYYFIKENLTRKVEFFENPLYLMSLLERFPNGFSSFLMYVKLHIIPHPLVSYYGYPHVEVSTWADYKVYVGALVMLAVLYAVYTYRNKLLGFGLLTFLIFIIPYTNFPFPAVGIIAERFAFSSVLGFSIVLVLCVVGLVDFIKKSKNNLSYYTFILFLFIGCAVLINRSRTKDWKNTLSLVRVDTKKAPKSFKLQMLHGDVAQLTMAKSRDTKRRTSYTNEAIEAYKKAIKLYPEYSGTYNNLGVLYSVSGNYRRAIPFIEKAIKLGDSTAVKYYNLGACYELLGKKIKAKEYYKRSLLIDKNYKKALDRLQILNGI